MSLACWTWLVDDCLGICELIIMKRFACTCIICFNIGTLMHYYNNFETMCIISNKGKLILLCMHIFLSMHVNPAPAYSFMYCMHLLILCHPLLYASSNLTDVLMAVLCFSKSKYSSIRLILHISLEVLPHCTTIVKQSVFDGIILSNFSWRCPFCW